ncbi:fimbria/pilus outer membrane usher protein [Massilia soli]|nr:fimbria/pilus outer membrane usher protein [Massilia soli]
MAVAAHCDAAELYLEVTLNGKATGKILQFSEGARGLRSSAQNLRELDLNPAAFGISGEEFDLADAHGLSVAYDAATQVLVLQVSDALRQPLALAARATRTVAEGVASPGFLLHYDLYSQIGGSAGRTAAFTELRYFTPQGVFSSTGTATLRGLGRHFIRYNTYWQRSNPLTLESTQIGDIVSSSLGWTRALRMGGVQWRRNFALRPDLLTYPVAALAGSAVVPSSVSLFVNGVQQFAADVPSGPFVVNQVAGINGAGQATIITRDALGRSVSSSLPLYVDSRMLATGLSDYSVELGAVRRDWSTRSFNYASSPAASGSWRYGIGPNLTVEAHGEAGRGLVNGGAALLWRIGQFGVVNAAAAASGGRGDGAQGSIGYQYIAPRFSIDLQSQRASRRYADLGTGEGTPVARVSDRASINATLPLGQSVGLSWLSYQSPMQPAANVVAASYAVALRSGVYVTVSGFRDQHDRSVRGVSATLSIALGNRIAGTVGKGRQNGADNRQFSMSRAPDFGGGFGWTLQKGDIGGQDFDQAQLQYLGSGGHATLFTQRTGELRSTAANVNGSLVYMDGALSAARQVGSSFAMVATGVADLPVVHENRRIGRTDARGHLLVPNLVPYANNLISIDTSALPPDARIANTSMQVVPQQMAGVVSRFTVERYSAASVVLHGADGKPVAAGTLFRNMASGATVLAGYDGIAFVDDLAADNTLRSADGACEVRFGFKRPADGSLPVIGPLACKAVNGTP